MHARVEHGGADRTGVGPQHVGLAGRQRRLRQRGGGGACEHAEAEERGLPYPWMVGWIRGVVGRRRGLSCGGRAACERRATGPWGAGASSPIGRRARACTGTTQTTGGEGTIPSEEATWPRGADADKPLAGGRRLCHTRRAPLHPTPTPPRAPHRRDRPRWPAPYRPARTRATGVARQFGPDCALRIQEAGVADQTRRRQGVEEHRLRHQGAGFGALRVNGSDVQASPLRGRRRDRNRHDPHRVRPGAG